MKFSIKPCRTIEDLIALLIKIYILISFFFPMYTFTANRNNLEIIISNLVIVLILILSLFIKCKSSKYNLFIFFFTFIIVIYLIVFVYYGITYYGCYLAIFNKIVSFSFAWILFVKLGKEFIGKYKIIYFLVNIFCASVIFSLGLYFFARIDGVFIENFTVWVRYVGEFNENRLTYVYVHKSSYGLILSLFLILCLKINNIPHRKTKIFLICSAIVCTNSITSIGAMLFIGMAYNFSNRKYKTNKIKFKFNKIIIVILIVLSTFAALNYMVTVRDMDTAGGRIIIWSAGIENIKNNPDGIGKDFFTRNFLADNNQTYNNFHNTFLNEMIHYSILVGIIYSFLILLIPIFSIFKYSNKIENAIYLLAVILILSFDNALHDSILTLYMTLIWIVYIYANDLTTENQIASN